MPMYLQCSGTRPAAYALGCVTQKYYLSLRDSVGSDEETIDGSKTRNKASQSSTRLFLRLSVEPAWRVHHPHRSRSPKAGPARD